MKHKRRFERIRKMIMRMQPTVYEIELPDWSNPDAIQPLTEKIIEAKLHDMEIGSVLYLLGAGVFYKHGEHPDAVMCIHRSPLRDMYKTDEQNIENGETENGTD